MWMDGTTYPHNISLEPLYAYTIHVAYIEPCTRYTTTLREFGENATEAGILNVSKISVPTSAYN